MKPRHKAYLKLNLISIFFLIVSFLSITLAWFAYSGLAKVDLDVDVKAWYIEFQQNNEPVSNNIVISLAEVYPGMETINEVVNIKNLGDSNAELKYKVVSARILNDDYDVNEENSEGTLDQLSHDYPFHININLSKNYALAKGDETTFTVSLSWPLDSDSDANDSVWGNKAFLFQRDEESKKQNDSTYQIRPSIKIIISVTAEQYVENSDSTDVEYSLGNTILYDVVNNRKCNEISSACIKTYIIDVHNKNKDNKVSLLPDLTNDYLISDYSNYGLVFSSITNGWMVDTRPLNVKDLLYIISNDVLKSYLIRNNISDQIIGYLNYNDRIDREITKMIGYDGYYVFDNTKYMYLTSNKCYWTDSVYDDDRGFAFTKLDNNRSKIYGELKTNNCTVVPVIQVPKYNL